LYRRRASISLCCHTNFSSKLSRSLISVCGLGPVAGSEPSAKNENIKCSVRLCGSTTLASHTIIHVSCHPNWQSFIEDRNGKWKKLISREHAFPEKQKWSNTKRMCIKKAKIYVGASFCLRKFQVKRLYHFYHTARTCNGPEKFTSVSCKIAGLSGPSAHVFPLPLSFGLK
jgi:hypothetical protein